MKEQWLCLHESRSTLLTHPTPPHGNWSWKSSACVCRTARKMMWLLCLCVHRNMNVIVPPHPTPPHRYLIMKEQCLCLRAGKMMRLRCLCVHGNVSVIVPACPTPPHPTGIWSWKSSVRTGTWTLLSHPTPPHPTPPHRYLIMKEQCLCLYESRKDDEVAVPVCARERERYYPTPPNRTPQRTMMKVQWLCPEWEMMRVRKWVTFCSLGAQVSEGAQVTEGAQVSEISGAQVRVWPKYEKPWNTMKHTSIPCSTMPDIILTGLHGAVCSRHGLQTNL